MKSSLVKIFRTLILGIPVVLAGCSADEPAPAPTIDPDDDEETYICFNCGASGSAMQWLPIVGGRAGENAIDAVMPESIGVWGYNDKASAGLSYSGVGEVFKNVEMYRIDTDKAHQLGLDQNWFEDNRWPYVTPMPWLRSTDETPVHYKFFAYAPYFPEDIRVDEMTYDNFHRVTWYNVPRYSSTDMMSIREFDVYTAKKAGEGKNPWQVMFMQHFQARLRFNFKLSKEFSDIRVIHLKKLEVVDLPGQTFTIILDFDRDADGHYTSTYMWDRNSVAGSYDSCEVSIDDGSDYVEYSKADTDFKPYGSVYVYPGDGIGSLKLRATYDVFDTTGQLLRENDTADSVVSLGLQGYGSSGTNVLEAGYYYNVNVKIYPAFIYVLSDNDPDSNGWMEMTPEPTN